MKLKDKKEFINKSLFFPEEKTLVIADLHLGYEEAMNESGIFFPREQFQQTKKELEDIFEKAGKLKEIIILGDLKHEFGRINRQEWIEVLEILDILSQNAEKIILIKGNHDTILEPIADKKNIEIKDYHIKNNICFFHGHKTFPECFDNKIDTWIIGHKHPSITLRKEAKAETYKCFLVGKYNKKQLIILPSFFPLIEGGDIFLEDTNLPFSINPSNFNILVVADKVYDFGKMRELNTKH